MSADECLGSKCPEFGDCFVERSRTAAKEVDVVVTTPTDLDDEQRELLERLAELRGEEVVHGTPPARGMFARLRENLRNL